MMWVVIGAFVMVWVALYGIAAYVINRDYVGCTMDDMDPAWCFDCPIKECARRSERDGTQR